jgi:hypothetical protein
MGMRKRLCSYFIAAIYLLVGGPFSPAAERVSLTGRVSDANGSPVEHATVLVYRAGVTKGYSLYCPTCYADCGKRAITDGKGMFTLRGLHPDLWFQLLVALDGYEPSLGNRVDPSRGLPVSATLVRRKPANDPTRLFRGEVQDSRGRPVRDALIQPAGLLLDSQTGNSIYGTVDGLDPAAVSNHEGQFEIAYSKPAPKILLSVEARGMAPTFSTIPAGTERHPITLREGAVVRGRLVRNGKPVGDAEMGLIGYPRGGFGANLQVIGSPYEEIRIGTQPDGSFVLTNVPVPGEWYVYGKMGSLAARGATGVIACRTKRDAEIVDIGDIQVKPAHRFHGKVILSDGKPIPDGMRVTINSERAWDDQTANLPPDGQFEFLGLAVGEYSIFAAVKGYSLPRTRMSATRKREDGSTETVTYPAGVAPPFSLDHDIDGYIIKLEPQN